MSAVRSQVLLHLGREPALQQGLDALLAMGCEAQVLDALLASWALLPADSWRLVSANVDILAREQLHHFVKYVLDKLQCLVLADAQDVVGNTPLAPDFIRTTCASQFGIGRQCAQHVARHVHLGNYSDEAVGGILDDVTDFILGVITAIADAVVDR